jgi:hypothetical protein
MFSTLLSSCSKLFGSSRTVRRACKALTPARKPSLEVETLEIRDVPSANPLAWQFQYYKVMDFQNAVSEVQAAAQAINSGAIFGTAQQDLNAAKNDVQMSYNWLVLQYDYGFESLATAQKDYAVLCAVWNKVNQDIQAVNSFFTTGGAVGDLLNWNGVYLGNLPNYYTGSNMMP